ARSIAGRSSDPRLLAIFAADRLEVAAPVLAAAPLDASGWAQVSAAASVEVRAFIHTVRGEPEVTVPATQAADAVIPEEQAPAADGEPHPAPSIGEMVARIERLKGRRSESEEEGQADPGVPPSSWREPAPTTGPSLFRWECDASGQIGWVDGAPRGALIGRRLPDEEDADRRLVRAFADRMPFDEAALTIPVPALEGDWKLSGIPAFSPTDGRFLGYRGIARRDAEEAIMVERPVMAGMPVAGDAEALRETIHEIKTPLNAIIGFAEIIDGQYLGPAHRNYRERAAEIVVQARILLAAIEDLDFAARMQGAASAVQTTATDTLLTPLGEEMAARAEARGVDFRWAGRGEEMALALDRDLAGRLLRRFLGAVIDSADRGEQLRLTLGAERGKALLSISRPAATLSLTSAQLLDPAFHTASEGEDSRLGLGFGLRLVRGLVRLAGGDLRLGGADFTLVIPAAKS
uniref:sensor histidine kinase n=1 Tax=Sphingomonas sp. TaxID=28214 RepID=UPI0018310582